MATTRIRRASANPPEYAVDQDGDRVYTEEDYAEKDSAPMPDEWASQRSVYPPAGWTGEAVLPDEAFQPDEEDVPDEAEWAEEDASPYYAAEDDYDLRYAGDGYTEELDPLSEELLTEEEQAELRRSHWQLISGLADFAGVILGTAAILVLVTLLVSLLNWLVSDLNQSFILLQKNL